jgi:hypothetical protein
MNKRLLRTQEPSIEAARYPGGVTRGGNEWSGGLFHGLTVNLRNYKALSVLPGLEHGSRNRNHGMFGSVAQDPDFTHWAWFVANKRRKLVQSRSRELAPFVRLKPGSVRVMAI